MISVGRTDKMKGVKCMTEMLYTMKEVSEILKCNVDYVHRLRKAGLLKCMKLGSYKVRKSELERFLAEFEGYDLTNPEQVVEL